MKANAREVPLGPGPIPNPPKLLFFVMRAVVRVMRCFVTQGIKVHEKKKATQVMIMQCLMGALAGSCQAFVRTVVYAPVFRDSLGKQKWTVAR